MSSSSRRSTTPPSRSISTARKRVSAAPLSRTWRKALVMATASTRFTDLNYWIDVKTGFDYLVQVQMPPIRMDKPEDIGSLPIATVNPAGQSDGPRRGDGPPGCAAWRVRPRHVAALSDPDRERRGRGHGPGRATGCPGDHRSREAAPRRPGGAHGPASADERDVQGARASDWRSPCS